MCSGVVAYQAIEQALEWLASEAVAAEHLADQLLLPMALAGGGSFTTPRMTEHLQSNMAVIQRFLPVVLESHEQGPQLLRIECRAL